MARLLVRTALANLRSRPLQTALVALILAAASATLALAVSLRAGAADPYEKIARATNAADVHVVGRGDLAALAHAPGVKAADGPFRLLGVRIRSRPTNYNIAIEGVGARPPRIDRPKLTDGRWLSGAPGELVLDRPTARQRGIHVGQRLTVLPRDRRTALTVVGIAVSAGRGRSWVSEGTLAALPPGGDPIGRVLELQLTDRDASGAFVDDVRRRYAPDELNAYDWRDDRQEVTDRTSTSSVVLGSASLAALLAVGFIIANAIGGRILASRRDIGLLKAAGFTPGGVTALFVIENLMVAGAASIVGTALGIALSPLLLEPTRQPAGHRHAQRAAGGHGGSGRPRRRGRGLPLHRAAGLARGPARRARGDRPGAHEHQHEALARRARRRRAAPAARRRPRRQGRVRQPLAGGDDDRQPRPDHGHRDHGARHRGDLPARHPGLLAARQALRADRRRQRGLSRPARAPCSARSRPRSRARRRSWGPPPRCRAARSTCGRARSAATTSAGPTRSATGA